MCFLKRFMIQCSKTTSFGPSRLTDAVRLSLAMFLSSKAFTLLNRFSHLFIT
jgi:hypothetical protein